MLAAQWSPENIGMSSIDSMSLYSSCMSWKSTTIPRRLHSSSIFSYHSLSLSRPIRLLTIASGCA